MGVEVEGFETGELEPVAVDVEVDAVEIRAFRGSRRSSVYREHVVGRGVLARVRAAARECGFPVLASLAGPRRLDPGEARQLAREADSLADSLRSAVLAAHLSAIAEVARWCSRSRRDSWMTIAGS